MILSWHALAPGPNSASLVRLSRAVASIEETLDPDLFQHMIFAEVLVVGVGYHFIEDTVDGYRLVRSPDTMLQRYDEMCEALGFAQRAMLPIGKRLRESGIPIDDMTLPAQVVIEALNPAERSEVFTHPSPGGNRRSFTLRGLSRGFRRRLI
jgi:hypothetical protein